MKTSTALKNGGFPDLTSKRGDETPLIISMTQNGSNQLFIDELITSTILLKN